MAATLRQHWLVKLKAGSDRTETDVITGFQI